jgi:hypothetical protein
MKKFFLLIILFLLSALSCNHKLTNAIITRNLYERTYVGNDTAYIPQDIIYFSYEYNFDTIPVNQWLTNIMSCDTIYVEQKILIKQIDDNTNYVFVLSKYEYPSVLYYSFLVRYTGKEKDLPKR